MTIRFIRSSEKNRITEELEKQFGITKLPYLLLETGKEKMLGFSGHLSKEEIIKLSKIANIDLIGIYLLKQENGFRLSFDATQLLHEQITKNIVQINDSECEKWLRGHDLEKEAPQGIVVIQHNNNFLGC